MTGCKGYGLRGSDARTEIERTKEADTPGEIPGRSGLQAERRTGNKFIMRGAWLRSKEMEEIIMTLSMKEKKILYAYGCPSHHNTVTRLKWLTALTVDPEANRAAGVFRFGCAEYNLGFVLSVVGFVLGKAVNRAPNMKLGGAEIDVLPL